MTFTHVAAGKVPVRIPDKFRSTAEKKAMVERLASDLSTTKTEDDRACTEIARLQAQLAQEEAERVVVPELDGDPVLQEEFADNGEHSHWNLFDSGSGVLLWTEDPEEEWHKHNRKPAHSVPASRVLKDGEVAVTRTELGPLRVIANHFSRGDHEWILEYTVPVEMALDALTALRAQGKEKP